MTTQNIFVFGLTDMQAGELETVRGAENYRFHSLLDYDSLVADTAIDFEELLDRARRQLEDFDGSVDGLVAH